MVIITVKCGEYLDHLIDGLHHEVDVDVCGHTVVSEGLAHHGADGQVGHIVIVCWDEMGRSRRVRIRTRVRVRLSKLGSELGSWLRSGL